MPSICVSNFDRPLQLAFLKRSSFSTESVETGPIVRGTLAVTSVPGTALRLMSGYAFASESFPVIPIWLVTLFACWRRQVLQV
jgi:hypothetical protein